MENIKLIAIRDKRFRIGSASAQKEIILPVRQISNKKITTGTVDNFSFEGTYVKASRSDQPFLFTGTGTLFHNGLKLYEGRWKNGKKNGRGTEYIREATLKYVGPFKDNVFSGKDGRLQRWPSETIIKQGTFKDNNLVKGKDFRRNGTLEYEGTLKDGVWNGKGTLYNQDQIITYDGGFKHGAFQGTGTLFSPTTGKKVFEGRFENGLKNGKGIEYTEDGKTILYRGMFKKDQRSGHGILFSPSTGKKVYEGMFYKGQEEGKGKGFFENGKVEYEGQFHRGEFYKGIQYFLSGSYMRGTFRDHLPNGYIYEYNRNGKLLSECHMQNGIYAGKCTFYHTNGKIQFKGWYVDGERNGEGVEYNSEGQKIRKGKWLKGVYIGGEKQKRQTAKRTKREANIRYFLQSKDLKYLKNLTVKDLKQFLRQKADKVSQSKTKKKLAKEIQQWHASIPRLRQAQQNTVYDAYMMEHVPFDEFLEDENRIILVTKENVNFGVYLEQREILYECAPRSANKSFRSYVGDPSAKGIVRLPTSTGGNFNFWRSGKLLDEIAAGKNVFHIDQEPANVRVLSKDVAMGGDIVSALHCDDRDIIKISIIKKSDKIGQGCRSTVSFEF